MDAVCRGLEHFNSFAKLRQGCRVERVLGDLDAGMERLGSGAGENMDFALPEDCCGVDASWGIMNR